MKYKITRVLVTKLFLTQEAGVGLADPGKQSHCCAGLRLRTVSLSSLQGNLTPYSERQ